MAEGMTRDEQELETIYVCPDDSAFVTPDGIGRHWFDDEDHAVDETGYTTVVYLDESPEDY